MITWIIHQVCDGQRMSYHTHGLNEYGSLELELNLMLVPAQAADFINLIGESIATGKRYQSGDRVDEIFTVPFYLFETTPVHGSFKGETVLRIVFCDPQFLFPWELGCHEEYRHQLDEKDISQMKCLLKESGILKGGFPS